jgi:hypothetical protein
LALLIEKHELGKIHEMIPFVAGKRVLKNWARINLIPKELLKIVPYLKRSYELTMKP